MNYAAPQNTPHCPCRDSGALPLTCPMGHATHCHYPLDCKTASCPDMAGRMDENTCEDELDQLPALLRAAEKRTRETLQAWARQNCRNCQGAGTVTINSSITVPWGPQPRRTETLTITREAICRCVRRPAP